MISLWTEGGGWVDGRKVHDFSSQKNAKGCLPKRDNSAFTIFPLYRKLISKGTRKYAKGEGGRIYELRVLLRVSIKLKWWKISMVFIMINLGTLELSSWGSQYSVIIWIMWLNNTPWLEDRQTGCRTQIWLYNNEAGCLSRLVGAPESIFACVLANTSGGYWKRRIAFSQVGKFSTIALTKWRVQQASGKDQQSIVACVKIPKHIPKLGPGRRWALWADIIIERHG